MTLLAISNRCSAPPMAGERLPLYHLPQVGEYDEQPRKYCTRCGAWLEPDHNDNQD